MAVRAPLATLVVATAFLPGRSAAAQTVRGVTIEAVSGLPVVGAQVVLLKSDTLVARAVTDSGGRFTLGVSASGTGYRVWSRRFGYAPHNTARFALRAGQDTLVTLRLRRLPVPLDSVVVEAERSRRLVREGFYDRRARGIGFFRTLEELEAQNPLFLDDLFWGMSVRLRRGRVVSPSIPDCSLTVALDGFVIREAWTELLHAHDIEAVEVYTSPAGVPVWLRGIVSPCGAVILWTKGSRD